MLLERKFSHRSDVWSYGVVVWEVLAYGETPYSSFTNKEVVVHVIQGFTLAPKPDCPAWAQILMNRCFNRDPNQRPSFSELLLKTESNQQDPAPNFSP